MPPECPKCKLTNPDSADRCDCGYDFVVGTIATNADSMKSEKSIGDLAAETVLTVGGLITGLATALLVTSSWNAPAKTRTSASSLGLLGNWRQLDGVRTEKPS